MTRGPQDDDLTAARSLALALANRDGYDATSIAREVLRDRVLLQDQAERGPVKAAALARRVAEWAVWFVREHPAEHWRNEVPARIVRMREAADARPWLGRSGPTDRRALEAAYLTGLIARSTKFGLAARTWGSRAGMLAPTANDASRRLVKAGALARLSKGSLTIAARWHLLRPRSLTVGLPPRPHLYELAARLALPVDPLVRELLAHDAFRPAALGDAGWLTVRWLDVAEPIRADDLCELTGLSRARARGVFGALQSEGLAARVPDGWIRVGDIELLAGLDRIAVSAGTAGSLEADRERHQVERQERDDDLDALAPRATCKRTDTPSELPEALSDTVKEVDDRAA